MSKRKPPSGPTWMTERARAFWTDALDKYELTGPEEVLLLEACRTIDRLEALHAAILADGVVVTGSKGQEVVNGALTESRGQAVVLHRLLAALKLPDGEVDGARTTAARAGGQARWRDEVTEARLRRGGGA